MFKTKKLKNNKCVLVKYDGNENIITIPETIDGMVVSKIDKEAFANTNVEFVVVPGSVKLIGDRAFANCENLSSVVILEGVEILGNNVFDNCKKLTNIKFPVSLEQFGDWGELNDEQLTVCTNNEYVVRYCYDIRVGLPKVQSDLNTELIRIEYSQRHDDEDDDYSDFVIEAINEDTCYIKKYFGISAEVFVPEYIKGFTVVKVGKEAFKNTPVKVVALSKTIKEIDDNAFENCEELQRVYMGESVERIGNYAFAKCVALEDIDFSSALKSIGDYAFAMCKKLNINTIPCALHHIGQYAFESCISLRDFFIPDSIDKIEKGTFKNCEGLNGCIFPKTLSIIEAEAFSGCKNIQILMLPQALTIIGKRAFAGCRSLIEVVIPSNIQVIEKKAFGLCRHLQRVQIKGDPLYVALDAFAVVYPKVIVETSSPVAICACLHNGISVNIHQMV